MSLPRRKFMLDCDTGTDDAQAMMMALSQPDIDLLAVTAVFGNSSLVNTSRNCLRILSFKGRTDIPVFRGSDMSMLGVPSKCDGYHGYDGLGDIQIPGVDPVDTSLIKQEHAVHALTRIAQENKGEVTLVATGPLTNIAMALHLDPLFGQNLKDIYVMGGNTTGYGNVSPCAEFNFLADPEAAYFVLNKLGRKITLATFDICENHAFSWEWYDKFTALETKTAALIRNFEKDMTQRERKRGVEKYIMMWDQVAMATAINNQVAMEMKDVYASIELQGPNTRGQLVIDWGNKLHKPVNVRLIMKLDQSLFSRLMHSAVKE